MSSDPREVASFPVIPPDLFTFIKGELQMYGEKGFDSDEFVKLHGEHIATMIALREKEKEVVNKRAIIHGTVNKYLKYIREEKTQPEKPKPEKSRPKILSLFGLS